MSAKWLTVAPPVPGDVAAAMRELGIEIVRIEGGEVWAHCPAHRARTGKTDRNPSFSVNQERGVFLCFSCGYQGAFPTLVADLLGLEPVAAEAWTTRHGTLDKVARVLRPAVVERWTAPEPSLAGYCFPPAAVLAARGLDDDGAARYGLLWDPESDGWILPIRDARGQLLGYQYKRGRLVRNRPRGIAKALTLFGAHAFTGDTVILVESPLDCARIWSAGIPGAVASFGAVVSDAQIDLLVRLSDRVVIALDNDDAGRQNADLVAHRLRGRAAVRFLRYPTRPVKDPGEMTDREIGDGVDGAYSELRRRLARC